jgi:hypothetical protein
VRVKLASSIASGDIDVHKITRSCNLHVVGCLNEMDPVEGAIGEQALTAAGMAVEAIRRQTYEKERRLTSNRR